MRLGVLIDGRITRWQLQALEQVSADHEIYLIKATPQKRKRSSRHALYYALNLFTVRNKMTRRVELPPERLNVRETFEFSPGFDGAWAVLPPSLFDWIGQKKLDAIVKFGLGLIRIPEQEVRPIPILSFHHGDPRKYRGRPAGFYELVNGEPFVGQIVQALGSKLDGGTVYAFTESRAVPHSYRQTLIEAYRLSPYLLGQAIENVRLNRPVPMEPDGRNYRLPSNATVVRFCLERLAHAVRRGLYGAFVEKRWKVACAEVQNTASPLEAVSEAEKVAWTTLPVGSWYNFYADPFFGAASNELFVEALNNRTGQGEVIRILDGRQETISGFAGHVSYPAPINHEGRQLLVPETAEWCPPTAFDVADGTAKVVAALDISERELLDPTILHSGRRTYLFANIRSAGPNVLHLWHADDLFSPFTLHPASPVRVSARGSRMAGEVAQWGGRLIRLGQDWKRAYGDGILAFEIVALSPTEYREEPMGEASFSRVRGPHTVNRRDNLLLFDYYSEEFSLLAGIRRSRRKH